MGPSDPEIGMRFASTHPPVAIQAAFRLLILAAAAAAKSAVITVSCRSMTRPSARLVLQSK